MRDAGADDHAMGLAGQVEVIGVAAAALQQRGVFLARDGLADGEFHQGRIDGVEWSVHGLPLVCGGVSVIPGSSFRDSRDRGGRQAEDRAGSFG